MPTASTYKPSKSGRLMLDVLRYIGKLTSPASPTDIAARMHISINTLMGYLVVLEEENFVMRTGGLYEPTSELAKIWAERKMLLQRRLAGTEKELKEIE